MKKILHFLEWLLFSLLGLFSLYMIIAVALSYLSTDPDDIECEQQETSYVATNGVHLYIIIPADNVEADILKNLEINSDVKYLSFGWGDKEFYINTPEWSDLTLGTAFTALLERSPTAIHVINYKNKRKHWVEMEICPNQMEGLNDYIKRYFKTDKGEYIKIEGITGYSANDHFFEAKGNYTFYRTSNVWVNQALKEINVETSIWSPFDFGVLHHIKKDR